MASLNDSSFTGILDDLLLVFSELDDKDDDINDDGDDDFVFGACDAVCDAVESGETCDDFCDDDTDIDEDNDDRALAASSGVRMSGIPHGETEGILGSFSLHFEPSTDCKWLWHLGWTTSEI